ncbi:MULTISPECIES: toprim domain-containing protein [Bacillaceae]|uniref:toprim domain-containing protein n=1 Tax=Bacillaceae TaxID=186817 RepID=UPI001BDEEF0B|nr:MULTISPECIES: toprim domain-containing protein [Bacillaceae]MDX8360834.1 toprim domain-containing protein [Cytobacillus sp. IB215316]
MAIIEINKVIIVEGKTDKQQVENVLNEPIEIICTNGTLSVTKLDEIIDSTFHQDVFVLVDADEAGNKLRQQFKREFPEAQHIYIDKVYREVAAAPLKHIAAVLFRANFIVKRQYL